MYARVRGERSPTHAPGALLERDAELGAIQGVLADARASQGGIVLIEAATGLGKSRLLDKAALLADEEGMVVLRASARALERDMPFGVALQLFEKSAARADADRRQRLFSGAAGLAAPLVLEGRTPERRGDGLHGLYWLSSNLAEGQPLVLAVDDVHWADSPTLHFLVYLAERISDLPVAVVATAAEGQPREPDPLLDELRAHAATVVLSPAPLSGDAATELLRESALPDVEARFGVACHELTAGNPLLLHELGAELAMRQVSPVQENSDAVRDLAPASIATATILGLRRLAEGAAELVQALAVLGNGADPRHVAELAGMSGERAVELAESLMRAGVLRREARLSFAHPVVRTAIYADRSAGERAEAHRRAAALLMADDIPEERVVPHVLAGRPAADPRAAEILARAAERAIRGGAPDHAVDLLRRALEEPPPAERRPALTLMLGRAEAAVGAPEAVERLTGVLDMIGEPSARAEAALQASRMLSTHARWAEAEATLERALQDVDGADEVLSARLRSARVAVSRLLPGPARHAPRVSLDDQTLEQTAAGRIVLADAAADGALSGTSSAAEVRELAARALGGGTLLDEETCDGLAFYFAVFALTVAEDLQAAELAASTAVEDARERGSVLGFATACHFRSLAILRRGRITEAAADAVNALAGRSRGWKLSLASAIAIRSECHLEHGELEDAAAELQAFREDGHALDPSAYRYMGTRGHVRLMQLSPHAALADLLEAGRLQEQFGGGNPAVYPWRSKASAAALAIGDRSEARRLAEEELGLATAFGAPGAIGIALQAVAAAAEGSEALEAREEAVRMLESSQLALDRARALVDLGGALRRAGRRREAREPLRQGLDLASRCEALALVKRAREELVAVGGRPRRDVTTGRESLTAREGQVAGLAAQGMSNREIAEALFVTVKTVEWHLRHAYEKLGVSSRKQLRSALVSEKSP
jgi:DNA-binding CsgD family transcriptional regulator